MLRNPFMPRETIFKYMGYRYDLSAFADCDDFTSTVWFDVFFNTEDNDIAANLAEKRARKFWNSSAK
jgi:hypothetical protein